MGKSYERATGVSLPFKGQPLQGHSGIKSMPDGTFWVITDNGMGARANSPDSMLYLNRYKMDWAGGKIERLETIFLHDPDKKLPTANTSRSDKEVQAESVAYIVASRYGIDTSDYSFPYIASWSQGKQLEQLNRFLNEIQESARTICDAIDSELQVLSEEQSEEQDESFGLAM